jgi:hypothetical protein
LAGTVSPSRPGRRGDDATFLTNRADIRFASRELATKITKDTKKGARIWEIHSLCSLCSLWLLLFVWDFVKAEVTTD